MVFGVGLLTGMLFSVMLEVMGNRDRQIILQPKILKQKYRFFLAVAIVLIMIVSGRIVYVLWERAGNNLSSNKKQVLRKVTPLTTLQSIPILFQNAPTTSIATTDWKTYINPTYRYSIQYPPNLSIIDMTDNTKSTMYSIEIGVPNAPGDQYPSLYIDVIPQNGALPEMYNNDDFMQNLKQYIASTSVGEVIRPKNEPFNIQFIRRDNMTIDGNTAYVFENMSVHEKRVVIQQSGILYVIGGYSLNAQFNQILSTFKFTTL